MPSIPEEAAEACYFFIYILKFYIKIEVIILDFIKKHIDFNFYFVSLIAFCTLLLIFPAFIFLPQKYGFENGLLENIQMFILFIILFMCLFAKNNQRVFQYAALALLIIMFREVNLGRTLFFPIPDTAGKYYSWKQISVQLGWPIGKCVHFTYGLYIFFVFLLFWIKGIFKEIFDLIKNIKLPFWNLLFMGLASFCGAIAEKATNNNFIFEEGFELLFYIALAGIVYLYTRDDRFVEKSMI